MPFLACSVRKESLKRLPISYLELLRDILPREYLHATEREQLEFALSSGSPLEIRKTARRLVQTLIDRRRFATVEVVPSQSGRLLRLHDPQKNLRIVIRLDEPMLTEGLDLIPLPLRPGAITTVRADLVRLLVSEQESLVQVDRVAGPREIIQRLEPAIRDALEVDAVNLLPIEHPPGEFWRTTPPAPLPLPEARLRELAQARTFLLRVHDFSRLDPTIQSPHDSGSALYIGLGDDAGGWRAVLEARDGREGAFDDEKTQLAVLLAGHFQTLLANAVRLQSFMFFDYLTGLYNRPYFDDQLGKMVSVARRQKQQFALCIIDVDDFKNFNTLYGYEGGDRVLATVGIVLRAGVRSSDTIARYGGEEFAALLAPPVTIDEALAIAERLRRAVEQEPFQVQNLDDRYVPEKITVSVGGALYPAHGPGSREIWNAANRMLLDAKEQGKNRVRFATE